MPFYNSGSSTRFLLEFMGLAVNYDNSFSISSLLKDISQLALVSPTKRGRLRKLVAGGLYVGASR